MSILLTTRSWRYPDFWVELLNGRMKDPPLSFVMSSNQFISESRGKNVLQVDFSTVS